MEEHWTISDTNEHWTGWAAALHDAGPAPLAEHYLAARQARAAEWALDLGCGTGRSFELLGRAGYRIAGLDPIPAALQASRRRTGAAHLIQGVADALPLRDASVSLALAIGLLFHLSPRELPATLAEIARVLQPGGTAILHFLEDGDSRREWHAGLDPSTISANSRQALILSFWPRPRLEALLAGAGLLLAELNLHITDQSDGQRREWVAICKGANVQRRGPFG
jgi:SAM-dependent methyltransferase